MKKMFSLVLALVMALSLTTVAWGAASVTVSDGSVAADETDLATAISNVDANGTVTLKSNMTLAAPLEINKAITLDLGGFTLTANGATPAIKVTANTTIQNGTVTTANTSGRLISVEASDVTFTLASNATVKMEGGGQAINGATNANTYTGITMNIYGNVVAKDWAVSLFSTNNKLNVEGATITSNTQNAISVSGNYGGNTVKIVDSVIKTTLTDMAALQADPIAAVFVSGTASNGGQTVTITSSQISGPSAVELKHSSLTVENSTLTATVAPYESTNGSGANTLGYALAVTNNTSDTTTSGTVTVNSGTFTGEVGIPAGTAAATTSDAAVTVSGGTFSDDVTDYLADGVSVQPDGTVAATASFSGTVGTATFTEDGDYYVLNASSVWEKVTYVPADEEDGAGNVAYFDGAQNYVLCKKTDDGALKLTSGMLSGDKLLGYVKVAFVEYTMKGEKVAKSAVVDCDTDLHAKGYKYVNPVTGLNEYYVDSTSGTKFILVGTEVKQVAADGSAILGGHILKLNKTAYLDTAKTIREYKCVCCGETFQGVTTKAPGVEYTTYEWDSRLDAAYVAAGYNTTGAIQTDLYLIKTATTTPSTDKVESAETFDAGIAMYVGMSVMAAAGSAVVLKKKD